MTASAPSPVGVCEGVVATLAGEFGRVPPDVVAAVVRDAERDLNGQVPSGSLGELLHRLAAYRLTQLLT